MRAALSAPSLWDDANAALSARGIAVPDRVLTRDWSKPYTPDLAVEDAWAEVYRDTHRWWDLYQLAEKLLDIDGVFIWVTGGNVAVRSWLVARPRKSAFGPGATGPIHAVSRKVKSPSRQHWP
jgi:tryptophan 2,3-dioxygenase